jgi:uncharacterized delta-60 repeat protein
LARKHPIAAATASVERLESRRLLSGSLDPAFGEGGKFVVDLGNGYDSADALAVQADGRIVVAGNGDTADVIRLMPDGTRDPSFVYPTSLPSTAIEFFDVGVQADGKIVAGGWQDFGPPDYDRPPILVRFNPNGSLDPTFGSGGVSMPFGPVNFGQVTTLSIRPDGKVLIGGNNDPASASWSQFVARVNSNGSLDTTFGTAGKTVVNFGGSYDEANDLLVLQDGKILLGGWGYYGEDGKWTLLRLTASGQRDNTFDGDGLKRLANQASRDEELYDLELTPGGKIVAVGTSESGTTGDGDMLAALIDAGGVFQGGFGSGGRVVTDLGGDIERLYDVVVDPAGTIYAAGGNRALNPASNGDWDVAVLSYTPTGAPNPNFNGGRPVTADVAGGYDFGQCIAIYSPGRLLVGGKVGDNYTADLGVLAFTRGNDPAPAVAAVYVGNSAWRGSDNNISTTYFKEYLQAQYLGSTKHGFAVPAGPRQLAALPWVNLDRVSIQFSQDVQVQKEDLVVRGALGGVYAFAAGAAGFTYHSPSRTATWTFAAPLGRDRLLLDLDAEAAGGVRNFEGDLLDGEWSDGGDAFPSGNGQGGGDLRFRFNVLPGDVNGSGVVLADDFSDVKRRFFRTSAAPGSGDGAYSVFADLDGNGSVLADDFSAVKLRFFQSLPPAPAGGAIAGRLRGEDQADATTVLRGR